ncbi:MAG: hypothetical protein ACFE9N_11165 [Promethearchaeota archaeon]
MRNKIGLTLLIIGGAIMIISSTIGSIGIYEFLRDYISGQINIEWLKIVLNVFVEILRWIANTGGGAVIVGAIIIALNHHRLGKWLVGIGLTFGTLALIIWVITKIIDITGIITDPQILTYLIRLRSYFTYNTGLQFIGVTVAIIGRNFVKKPKKVKEEEAEKEEVEIAEEENEKVETQPPIPFQNKYCPNCGATFPFNAQFCSECGSAFDS